MQPYYFGGSNIHHLDIFTTQQQFNLSVGSNSFAYSHEQLALISPAAFSFFINADNIIDFNVNYDQNFEWINNFTQFDSLFHNTSKIEITK
jgi:hypothetical protein